MWSGSHIHSKHIQGVWQPSHAVDVDMDPSSCLYSHTCWPRFGKLDKILGHCLVLNETFVQWLRLQTHVNGLPISTPNIYKVFGNLHMLLIGI
jgi:hypothetical protein